MNFFSRKSKCQKSSKCKTPTNAAPAATPSSKQAVPRSRGARASPTQGGSMLQTLGNGATRTVKDPTTRTVLRGSSSRMSGGSSSRMQGGSSSRTMGATGASRSGSYNSIPINGALYVDQPSSYTQPPRSAMYPPPPPPPPPPTYMQPTSPWGRQVDQCGYGDTQGGGLHYNPNFDVYGRNPNYTAEQHAAIDAFEAFERWISPYN